LKKCLYTTAVLFAALAMTGCAQFENQVKEPVGAQVASQALDMMRKGGFVLVMRHGETNPTEADTNTANLADCEHQRTLTDTGRLAATNIGTLFAREHVPVAQIFASRYCRAIDTAKRVAEHTKPKSLLVSEDFTEGGQVVSPNENGRRAKALRAAVSLQPTAGTNTLIVSHKPNMMDAFGASYYGFSDGEMAIFQPAADLPEGYKLIARVKLKDWADYGKEKKSLGLL
jgi:phosphohistidine phosphatase SixA